MKKIFYHQLYFSLPKIEPKQRGFVTALIPLSSLCGISCRLSFTIKLGTASTDFS